MKQIRKKTVIAVIAAVLLAIAYLVYSRPMTLTQRYPMLTHEKCTEIRGDWHDGTQIDMTEVSVSRDSEEFSALWELLCEQPCRRSLRDLLPRGTRTHRAELGDFRWEATFCFDDVEFPDGSIGRGDMLRIQYWYGELDLYFEDGRLSCHTDEQERWAEEILNLLR